MRSHLWHHQFVQDWVAQRFGLVFAKIHEQRPTTHNKTNEHHDPVLVVLLIHKISLMLWVLFNLFITQARHIHRQFFMQRAINWLGQITKIDIILKQSFIIFWLVSHTTVEHIDTGLVGQLTGNIFKFVQGGFLRQDLGVALARLAYNLYVVLFLGNVKLVFTLLTFIHQLL